MRDEERLKEVLPFGKFVTLVACNYSRNGALSTALAGHPSPIILGHAGEATELLLPPNAPLGFSRSKDFKTGETLLSATETLLLYTDGVSESRREGRLFGPEGIADCCRVMAGCELAELAAGVCKASAEFHDLRLPGDDRLALAAKPTGLSG